MGAFAGAVKIISLFVHRFPYFFLFLPCIFGIAVLIKFPVTALFFHFAGDKTIFPDLYIERAGTFLPSLFGSPHSFGVKIIEFSIRKPADFFFHDGHFVLLELLALFRGRIINSCAFAGFAEIIIFSQYVFPHIFLELEGYSFRIIVVITPDIAGFGHFGGDSALLVNQITFSGRKFFPSRFCDRRSVYVQQIMVVL